MNKKVEFTNNKKDECVVCSSKTFLSLAVKGNAEGRVDNYVSISLCDKCVVKLLEQVHDKREDLVDDLLRNKEGLSLADIRKSTETIARLEEHLENSSAPLGEDDYV